MKPIEISIHTEISSCLYHVFITSSNILSHDLSNALSTIAIRYIEQAEMAFKVAHKKRKIKKIQIQITKITLKILENSHLEKKNLVFLNYVNNRKPNRAKKKIS